MDLKQKNNSKTGNLYFNHFNHFSSPLLVLESWHGWPVLASMLESPHFEVCSHGRTWSLRFGRSRRVSRRFRKKGLDQCGLASAWKPRENPPVAQKSTVWKPTSWMGFLVEYIFFKCIYRCEWCEYLYIYIVWCFCNGPKLRKCTFAVVQIMEDYRLNMNKLLIWWNTFCIHKDCFKQKSAHSTLPPTTVGPGPGCGLCLQASEVSNSWCLCLVVGPVAVESVRNPSWRDTVRATRDGWKWVVLNLQ